MSLLLRQVRNLGVRTGTFRPVQRLTVPERLVRGVNPLDLSAPAVFMKVYDEHVDLLYFILKDLGVALDQRDDFVQEAFLRLLRAQDSVDAAKVKGFLASTLRNLVIDGARRARFRRTEPAGEELPTHARSLWEHDPERKSEMSVVGDLVAEIAASSGGEAFGLFYGEGFSVKEIAVRLGEPEGTVSSRIHRLRRKFSDQVKTRIAEAR